MNLFVLYKITLFDPKLKIKIDRIRKQKNGAGGRITNAPPPFTIALTAREWAHTWDGRVRTTMSGWSEFSNQDLYGNPERNAEKFESQGFSEMAPAELLTELIYWSKGREMGRLIS